MYNIFKPGFKPDPKKVTPKKEPKGFNKNRKPTGEMAVFEEIWSIRPHVSQISGEDLGDILDVSYFSHILPKGQNKYPHYKLDPRNIILKTKDEHYMWEHCKSALLDLPEWKWIFDLENELKEEYKKLYPGKK